jgi:arachidonate 15-lipoxygenase
MFPRMCAEGWDFFMSDTAGRTNPQLPQHASPDDQERRARDIGSARKTYGWTTQVTTLPGVPLSTAVPFADKPTVPWFLTAAKVALAVAENALANKRAEGEKGTSEHDARLAEIKERVTDIHTQHTAATAPVTGLSGLFSAAVGGAGALLGAHGATLDGHLDELQEIVRKNRLSPKAAQDLSSFADLFRTLPLPAVATTFQDDSTFASMRVAGPNSVLIEGIEAPPAKFPVTEAQYQSVMGSGDSLAAAGVEGRLYLLDYAALGDIVPGVVNGKQKYLERPLALFAVPRGERSLVPVAIQCSQDPAKNPIHLRPAKREWSWEMAKFVVQVADGNYHELFSHLARTHLVMEAVAVANHRALAPEHPVNLLLSAHTEGTLFINKAAAGSLIAAGGPIEAIFAGTIDTIQLAAVNDRLSFDFTAHMLPNDLAARRVADPKGLPDYPYRDDALLVWGAIERWVRAYLGTYYREDDDVIGDTELAAFCAEIRSSGRVKGFPLIQTIEELVGAVTMMVFTGSAQHAAVNFPQQTDMTWVPNVTGSGWAPGPDSGEEPSEARWFAMMPAVDLALEQLNTLWVLGGVHYRKLGDYLAPSFPYHPWFRDPDITRDGGPLEDFRNDLRAVEAQIERNNLLRAVAYNYLLPSQVPESINI